MNAPAFPPRAAPVDRFRADLQAVNMSPLWDVMSALVTPHPMSPAAPAQWSYAEVRPLIMEGGRAISAERADRRVLILENPGLPGASSVTRSLYAGLQLVLPGEVAPAHRHTQSALRFVVEGRGAYTTVEGERLRMEAGDLLLTPPWRWHDHGNDGEGPVVWLDGLDVQLVNLLDTSFAEPNPVARQTPRGEPGEGEARYGANLAPLDDEAPPQPCSPLMRYPYATTSATLSEVMSRGVDPWHGVRMRYTHPQTGGWPLMTMGPFAQRLPAGFETRPYRSTDGTVFLVKDGVGSARVGEESYRLEPGDVFVAPSWIPRTFQAESELTLLAFSDRPAQEKFGLWRERRDGAAA